jgi:hypothetical protein
VLDADGLIAPTEGQRKRGIGLSYKGLWGYHPLLISLANTKEVLFLVNRSGNRPGRRLSGQGHRAVLQGRLPEHPAAWRHGLQPDLEAGRVGRGRQHQIHPGD